ncbi:DNA replication factor C, large subunit [Martensiomyces pterosporus]|nr:DNA replication factor C, large subunit [Martensiomyces pterosporus]
MPPKTSASSRKRKAVVYSSDEDIDPESFFGSTEAKPQAGTRSSRSKKAAAPAPAAEAPVGVTVHDASELGVVKKKAFNYADMVLGKEAGVSAGSVDIPQGDPSCLAGLTFVFTGNMEQMTRKKAEDAVKCHGGRVTGSVSKNTSYLVAGSEPGATKVNKAQSIGTKVLYEGDFITFILQKNGQAKQAEQTEQTEQTEAPDSAGSNEVPESPAPKTKKLKVKNAEKVEDQPAEAIGFDASDLPDVAPKAFSYASKAGSAASAPGSKEIPKGAPGCLSGLTFVVTGEMEALSREQAEDLIKSYGGRVTKAVSGNTSYLVVGSDPGSSKVKKAKTLRTRCLYEDHLLKLIGMSSRDDSTAGAEAQEAPAAAKVAGSDVAKAGAKRSRTQAAAAPSKTPAPASVPSSQSSAVAAASGDAQLWTDKYMPTKLKELCGHKEAAKDILKWLSWWASGDIPDKRAVLISGPPGIGKTTTAHLVAKLAGFDVLELNASEARNKKALSELLGNTISNRSIREFDRKAVVDLEREQEQQQMEDKDVKENVTASGAKRMVVIMDEVDGMSGGDRGGSAELIQLVKRTKIPIICICNDRQSTKVKSLANYCEDMRFRRPTEAQMRARLNTIAYRENLKLDQNAITQLVQSTHNDIRQIINLMSSYALSKSSMSYLESKAFTTLNKKEVSVGPFDVIGKYMNGTENASATFAEKLDLYYSDFSIVPLFVQENYIDNRPAAGTDDLAALECLSHAADYIAQGDVVENKLRGSQQWGLMPLHAALSCVGPSYHMRGGHMGMYRFPGWLGQNSKGTKLARYLTEIQSHMRLRVSADKTEIRKSYIPAMVPELVTPLITQGAGGISDVASLMDHYYLTKDNWDAMLNLHLDGEAMLKKIPSAVKASFTREYNKASHPVAFQESRGASAVKALSAAAASIKPDSEDFIENDDDTGDDEGDENASDSEGDGLGSDKLIKAAKPKGKAAAKATKGKAAARPKGKAARPRKEK